MFNNEENVLFDEISMTCYFPDEILAGLKIFGLAYLL